MGKDPKFATRIELGLKMIERVREEGFPFEAVAFDALYGRSIWLRRKLMEKGITYMAIPALMEEPVPSLKSNAICIDIERTSYKVPISVIGWYEPGSFSSQE